MRARGNPDPHLVSLLEPGSLEADRYRVLRHALELKHEEGRRVFAVTSPGIGDGKTTTVINLAGALAQDPDSQVLLVEADLRRPCLLERLGMAADRGPGVMQMVMRPSLPAAEAIRPVPEFNLWVAPAGGHTETPYQLLKSPRLWDFMAVTRERFDYVLVDTPPLLACPDFRLIERWCDATLLVVAANHTPRQLVTEAAAQLDAAKALGVVLNAEDSAASSYYYGYRNGGYQRRTRKP
jgi:capsular exopolysaccharide synthesis family protein